MISKILVILLLAFPIVALASEDHNTFYITVKNKSQDNATIFLGKDDGDTQNWECGDFCMNQNVPSNSSKNFKFNTRAFQSFVSQYTGIQTVNISYGQMTSKVQFWIDHPHQVDTNIKTAILGSYLPGRIFGAKYSSNVYLVSAGVGTNSENIVPDIYVENIGVDFGTAHITLILN